MSGTQFKITQQTKNWKMTHYQDKALSIQVKSKVIKILN